MDKNEIDNPFHLPIVDKGIPKRKRVQDNVVDIDAMVKERPKKNEVPKHKFKPFQLKEKKGPWTEDKNLFMLMMSWIFSMFAGVAGGMIGSYILMKCPSLNCMITYLMIALVFLPVTALSLIVYLKKSAATWK